MSKTLEAAVERSRLLMALGDSSHTAAVVSETTSELEQLKGQIEKLTEMVAAIPVRHAAACEEAALPLLAISDGFFRLF